MNYEFFDREQHTGKVQIRSEADLFRKLHEYRKMEPFILELISETGEKLTIGVGGPLSFVQHTGPAGLPPYVCALTDNASSGVGAEFMISGTPTPVLNK